MSSQIEVKRNRRKVEEVGESSLWKEGEGAVVQLEGAEGGEGRDGIQVQRVRGQVKFLDKRRDCRGMLHYRKIWVESRRNGGQTRIFAISGDVRPPGRNKL